MKKIVFINFPVSGHVNPQLNLCKELAAKEVKLIYYTAECYFEKFKGIANIELRKYPDGFMRFYEELTGNTSDLNKIFAILYMFYALTENVMDFMVREIGAEKPDFIISDCLALWGKIAARHHQIPFAIFIPSFMGDPIMMQQSPEFQREILKAMLFEFPFVMKMNTTIKRIEQKYPKIVDQPTQLWSHQDKFTIVTTSREFHPGGAQYPDNVKFIGPAHIEDSDGAVAKDTIFISLGTIGCSDTFWDLCIDATDNLGYEVVISFGGVTHNKLSRKNIPAHVKVHDNLPLDAYREVLKRSVLFISHGGFNSISDSITYKTPLLIWPTTAEQTANGRIVQNLGCGRYLKPKGVSVTGLREQINGIISDPDISANLEKVRATFQNSMRYSGVVAELNREFHLFEEAKA